MAHILVVEDEDHLAKGIKFNLEGEGYQVTIAGDGNRALELIKHASKPIDLVILDVMLPGMSGYAVCESLRASGGEMPVLILSARTLAEDRTRGFDVGADQYLAKPFELEELLSRVKGLLVRYGQRQQKKEGRRQPLGTYEFCGKTINFERYEVQADGQTVQLTPLEMRLVQYFVQNEGRVVSRREILENVWEQPGYLQTRAPDQFIRRLRKIFEKDPANPRHFLTIRDAGYRFISDPHFGH